MTNLNKARCRKRHLLRLMEDAELRRRMGEAGRKRAAENFDYRHVAQRFVEMVSERLGIA